MSGLVQFLVTISGGSYTVRRNKYASQKLGYFVASPPSLISRIILYKIDRPRT